MKFNLKRIKRILIITVVTVVSVVLIAIGGFAIYYFSKAGATSGAARMATDWRHNTADIICEETGTLITLPGDWHRWRGENFDGAAIDTTLNLDWSQSPPALSWAFRYSGAGYSGPAVAGTTLFLSGAAEG